MNPLLQYATPNQAKYLEALELHGTGAKAAEALGVSKSTINMAVANLKVKAASQGYAPGSFTSGVAAGYAMGKVTVQRAADGSVERTWERQSPDQQAQATALKAVIEALTEDLPRVAPTPAPTVSNDLLATVYTLTDSHVGAMCWKEEGGEDWDLNIAEATLVGCFKKMIDASPNSKVGIVAQLGDFLHSDSNKSITPSHGHLLDSAARYTQSVRAAVRILRRVVTMALEKHEQVHVLMAEGNHDEASSIWLRTLFAAVYENEPRVTVDTAALPYYAYQHGLTMLAWHHGHLKKNEGLPLLFATQQPKMWGATTKRYAHCGHRHHVEEKEHSGMTVVQHTTLAARDAYAARGGWHSERAVTAITYHKQFGKHSTVTICPEMLN